MNFYKDFFASLCFIFFGAALAFKHPYLYFGAMMCACLSRTASRKEWRNPDWAEALYERWRLRRGNNGIEASDDEESSKP